MTTILEGTSVPDTPDVRAAQGNLDAVTQQWVDVGVEAGLFVASLHPTGGQIADGISLARNVSSGNYGAAVVDGIGMVPVLGDLFKGFFRGRRITRAVEAADAALDVARRNMQRVGEIARRKLASRTLRNRIRQRRDDIMRKYEGCNDAVCRQARDEELRDLYGRGNLPAEGTGTWRNADGSPAAVGEGMFVPDPNNPTGARLADALDQHGATGIPYSNGQPDLSGFPPPGSASPNGNAYSVEIEQSLTGDRTADRNASWGAWRDQYGADYDDPTGGHWHHSGDGATMQYVDQDIHGALSHAGDASVNQSPEF
ncbi:HNH endonuclease [Alphaproteobacteria bacterium KMM 3653]|uniref:HNH endonuclease n=1 Tax=Harenicola maris TaxID=2841044 RepID=A0AAP2G8D5_9RHOB|nr:HNH endonuclease [Harenicola maris]